MALRDSGLSDPRPPLAWMAAIAVAVALVTAGGLFLLYWRTPGGAAVNAARGTSDTVVGAAGSVLAAPVRLTDRGADTISDYFFAASQNRDLKRKLTAALTWRDRAVALSEENVRLRAMLGVRTDPPLPMVFAHTVLDARGPFSNSRLADAGAAQGVNEGNPVLSDHGLVGRVVGVAGGVSRIMLLNDLKSRTPVLILRTNARAILSGDGGENPLLGYLRSHDAPREGDRVLTSGDGGVIPRGLPVGRVVKGGDGSWRVALDSQTAPIDDVRILLFRDFSQLTPPADLAPRNLPSMATGAPAVAETPAPSPSQSPKPAKVARP